MLQIPSSRVTFVKGGAFYSSRRIPKELKRHAAPPRIAHSRRTRPAKAAEARALRAADRVEAHGLHQRPCV